MVCLVVIIYHLHQSLGYLGPVEHIEKELARMRRLVLPMWSAGTKYWQDKKKSPTKSRFVRKVKFSILTQLF
jgi:hypothetical protein